MKISRTETEARASRLIDYLEANAYRVLTGEEIVTQGLGLQPNRKHSMSAWIKSNIDLFPGLTILPGKGYLYAPVEKPVPIGISLSSFNATYDDRPVSRFAVWLMTSAGITHAEASEALHIKRVNFNEKLSKDRLSIEELCKVANLCGYSICVTKQEDFNTLKAMDLCDLFAKEV